MKITIQLWEVDLKVLKELGYRLGKTDDGSASITLEIEDLDLEAILEQE